MAIKGSLLQKGDIYQAKEDIITFYDPFYWWRKSHS